jgi:prepilin-type N-terminal cleavage/methylation domain-containing protein
MGCFRRIMKQIKHIKSCQKSRGMTLLEILVALLVLVIGILPVIGVFTQYFGVANYQTDQETALKIAESTMTKLLSSKFSDIAAGVSFPLDLSFQTPSGVFAGKLTFTGTKGESAPISLGKSSFKIDFNVIKVYEAFKITNIVNKAMVLKYPATTPPPDPIPPPPPAPPPPPLPPAVPVFPGMYVHDYSCTNDFLAFHLKVTYGDPEKSVDLMTFRADMSN